MYNDLQWQVKFEGETNFTDIPDATANIFNYDEVTFSQSVIRLAAVLGDQTLYSNELKINSYVLPTVSIVKTPNANVTINPDGE